MGVAIKPVETGNTVKEEGEEEEDNRDGDDQPRVLHAAPPQREEAGGPWLERKTGRWLRKMN